MGIYDDENGKQNYVIKWDYIIDYVGSYYMHLKQNEIFEGVGMLEKIYKNGLPTGKYRLSLNPWDGHIKNRMYLKIITQDYGNPIIKLTRNEIPSVLVKKKYIEGEYVNE